MAHAQLSGTRAALVALGLTLGLIWQGSAAADILRVPDDFPTIQAAIDAAQVGDEIILAPGVYENPSVVIDGARALTVTIRSEDPADPAVVAQTVLYDPEDDRILDITGIEPVSVTLDGLTIRRPSVRTDDATIRAVDADLTVKRCVLDGGTETTGATTTLLDASESQAVPTMEPTTVVLKDNRVLGRIGRLRISAAASVIDGLDTSDPTARGSVLLQGPDDATAMEIRNSWITIPVVMKAGSSIEPLIVDTTFADYYGKVLSVEFPFPFETAIRLERVEFLRILRTPGWSNAIEIYGNVLGKDLSLRDSGNINATWLFEIFGTASIDGFVIDNNISGSIVLHIQGATPTPETATVILNNILATGNDTISGTVEWHGNGSIRNSSFQRNKGQALALYGRGASGNINGNTISIEQCIFKYNTPSPSAFFQPTIGGYVRFSDSLIRVVDTIIADNTSLAAGVIGFRLISGDETEPSIVFERCLIVGNTGDTAAVNYGGARFIDSVIIDNTALDGSTRLGRGSAELINTIFIDRAPDAPAIAEVPTDSGPVTLSVANSIVGPVNFGLGSSSLDPLFIRPPSDGGDGWGDDPATPDIDESLNDDFGDLRLRPGSPAIDAGTNDFFTPGDTDLDGNPRLADDPGIPGAFVDLGAYEFQGTTCLADINQNGELEQSDFDAWLDAYTNATARADQNRDGVVTPSDFFAWVSNYNTGCP